MKRPLFLITMYNFFLQIWMNWKNKIKQNKMQ